MAEYAGSQLQASIIATVYKKAYLEEHNVDITDYAKHFCTQNRKYGKSFTRHDVEWYWEGNIRAVFDAVDPSHNRLISQIRCPKFDTYWKRNTEPAAQKAKELLQQQQGLWPLKPKTKEKIHLKSALILGNHTERWIVPDVSLMAIDDVFFNTFVINVRAVNVDDANTSLNRSKLFRLWGALIKKVYGFVPKEVQVEKLKEAFSTHPPITEAGFEEFFGPPSKKRKIGPSSEDSTVNEEHSVDAQKERRVSLGEFHVRTFDKESTLDPSLKPILKYTYIPSLSATAEPQDSAAPGSSIGADGGEGGEKTFDRAQKRIQDLEKQLIELKLAKTELQHKHQTEKGMRRGAERRISWLLVDLKKSQDLVSELEKQHTRSL